jgi:hypothetical protein
MKDFRDVLYNNAYWTFSNFQVVCALWVASHPSCNHIRHSSSFQVFREDFRQQRCRWPAGVERECLLSKDGMLSQPQRVKEGHSAQVTSVTEVVEHEVTFSPTDLEVEDLIE